MRKKEAFLGYDEVMPFDGPVTGDFDEADVFLVVVVVGLGLEFYFGIESYEKNH